MDITYKDVLRKAKTFLEQGWHKYQSAKNSKGESVDPASPDAVSWCSYGAFERARWEYKLLPFQEPAYQAFNKLRQAIPGQNSSLMIWNDSANTKEEVLALFQKVIDSDEAIV